MVVSPLRWPPSLHLNGQRRSCWAELGSAWNESFKVAGIR